MKKAEEEIAKLKAEIDRLEELSKKNNLLMYGVPHRADFEDYDTCVKAVTDKLYRYETDMMMIRWEIRAAFSGKSEQL